MNKKSYFVANAVLMIFVGVIVSSCYLKPESTYKGEVLLKPDQLKPFVDKDAGIKMGLPEGWQQVPLPKAADEDLRLKFTKKATEGTMLVYCQGAFVARYALSLLPMLVVQGLDDKAVRIWENQSLGGGLFDPEFSTWTGKKMVGYDLVEMNYYIAWKMSPGSCKYGLVLYGLKQYAPELEKDFLGILSSLK